MQLAVGMTVEGKVTGITSFGAFVELPTGQTGMVHISEVAPTFVREIRDFVSEGQTVKVKILNIGDNNKISLSMKQAEGAQAPKKGGAPRSGQHRAPRRRPEPQQHRPGTYEWQPRRMESASFEDMMSHFKQTSDEKISDLRRTVEGKHGSYSRRGGNRQ